MNQLREPVLQIERTWRVDDFPDREILGILSHCYQLLKAIVRDCYVTVGIPDPSSWEYQERDRSILTGHVSRQSKITSIDLKDGGIIHQDVKALKISEEDMNAARHRYSPVDLATARLDEDESDPFSRLDRLVELSRAILEKDGQHVSMVHYFFEDSAPEMHLIGPCDRTQLYLLIRHIAEDVATKRITGLIFMMEQWVCSSEKAGPRGECLTVACIRNDGRFQVHFTPFRKENDVILLGTTTVETDLAAHHWLRPIVNAWSI